MGRYIDEILQPGEKVLYSTNAHWIFYLPAIAAWIVALVLLVLSRATITEGIVLLCLSAAAVVAIVALYWTVEGLVPPLDHRDRRHQSAGRPQDRVHQAPHLRDGLDKVESVDVNQSILGRILELRRRDHPRRRRGQGNHLNHCLAARHFAIPSPRDRSGAHPMAMQQNSPVKSSPAPGPRSIRPRSRSSRNCRRNGGIPTARWRRCTRSTRCG